MDLCSTNGTAFSFAAVFRNAPSPNAQTLTVTYSGQAVCSTADNALIISIDPSSCHQAGISFPSFCNYAASLYNGEFNYGVSTGGILMIDRWSGSLYPVVFNCKSNNSCDMSLACNSSVSLEAITNVYGGNVSVTDSHVQLSENSTVTIDGPSTTIQGSNFTLEQSPSVTETFITVEGGTTIINPLNTTTYNFLTSTPTSCAGWADWKASRAANVSLNTGAWTALAFTGTSVLTSPEDWSLPSASVLQFDGDHSDMGYQFTLCLQSATLFNPTPQGMQVLITLYNITSSIGPVDANAIATTAIIINSTNPEFVSGTCISLITADIFEDNQFSVYATLNVTDGTGTTKSLDRISVSLTVIPIGCQGVTNNFNLNVTFGNASLDVGCPMIKTYNPISNTVDLTTDGLTYFRVNSVSYHGGRVEFVDTSSLLWTQVSSTPGSGCGGTTRYEANVPSELSNLTECLTCNDNDTLTIGKNTTINGTVTATKLCSQEPQCEVRADTPVTGDGDGDGYVHVPCFACGDDGNNHGGGGGGGGGNNGGGAPPIMLVPPIVGLVPPVIVVPVVAVATPPTGGGLGGVPRTTGGVYLPIIDISNPPFCGDTGGNGSTYGLAGIDNSELPNKLYVCERTANGSYAWVPHCGCSNAANNQTSFYTNSTIQLTCSTLYADNCSQTILHGVTAVDTLYINGTQILPGNGTGMPCCAATGVIQGTNIVVTGAIGTDQTVATSLTPTFTTVTTTDLTVTGTITGAGIPVTGVIQGSNIVVTGAIGTNQTVATSATPSFTSVTVTGAVTSTNTGNPLLTSLVRGAFSTGACSGGSTAPIASFVGSTLGPVYYFTFTTGDGACVGSFATITTFTHTACPTLPACVISGSSTEPGLITLTSFDASTFIMRWSSTAAAPIASTAYTSTFVCTCV